jgi:DDE_Tnp_1-associated
VKSLIEKLEGVSDPRKKVLERYNLPGLLILITIGMMQGSRSSRGIARFAVTNWKILSQKLSFKRKAAPSHMTISTILKIVDWKELEKVVQEWMSEQLPKEAAGEWEKRMIAVDGKALGATVTDSQESSQNFVMFAHALAVSSGLVVGASGFETKEDSEGKVVERLLEAFTGQGYVFTFDALHTQKKR